MIPELENARVTELQVRMDCNGCVRRIKKAMLGVDGVYDVYVDLNQQKLTVIGRADPEKIVRAIKRTRRTATVCSQKEPGQPPNGSEPPPPPSTEQPAPEAPANQPPNGAPPAGAPPPSEPPKDAPPHEKPSEAKEVALTNAKDAEEIHMIHLYPHSYVYKAHWNHYPASAQHELPSFIAHGYNSFRLPYDGQEAYDRDYHRRQGGVDDGNQITSMFDDEHYENPDACTIL